MELNWDNAKDWLKKANEEKQEEDEPSWEWDCNFKLDYDGPLLAISSRFYPPHKNYGDWWEGDVKVFILGEEIQKKFFKCDTLDILKEEVEAFTKEYAGKVKGLIAQLN